MHVAVFIDQEPSFCHSKQSMQGMWNEIAKEVGLTVNSGLRWEFGWTPRDIPESHRIGFLGDERLTEVLWVAELMDGAG